MFCDLYWFCVTLRCKGLQPGERKTSQNGLSLFMTAQTYFMNFEGEN